MSLKKNNNSGFTMIEMMIVMTIIGIIGVGILPHLMKARCQAQLTACQLNLKAIATAIQTYEVQHKTIPDDLDILREEQFLGSLPICPSDGKSYGYEVSRQPDDYTISCEGNFHNLMFDYVEEGYPKFTPSRSIILKSD
jgi:prepilin-type N-terminal cleavage/methylation domain-containing protein